jgi:hypothetical protein
LRSGSARDDEGAVAVLVAICLVAVMGMVAMTIDVGSLLLRQRALVNASDAAALAAARSCYDTKDTEVPGDVADHYAMVNSGGLTTTDGGIVLAQTEGCDSGHSGHVTVRYGQDESLFFAPVLGQGRTAHVGTEATATWGGAGGTAPIPLVLNSGALQGPCDIPDVPSGATCGLWYDNNVFGGSAFGFLDVKYPGGWDVLVDDNCNNSGGSSQLRDWINGNDPVGTLHLNYPFHTYVCVDGGLRGNVATSVWGEITKIIGQTRDFPINGVSPADGATQVMRLGQIDKYNIIGFAHMKIMNVLTVAEAGGSPSSDSTCSKQSPSALNGGSGASGTFFPWSVMGGGNGCPGSTVPDIVDSVALGSLVEGVDFTVTNLGFTLKTNVVLPRHSAVSFHWHLNGIAGSCGTAAPPNASARCLIVQWNGYTLGGDDPSGGADFGFGAVKLCDLGYGTCTDTT